MANAYVRVLRGSKSSHGSCEETSDGGANASRDRSPRRYSRGTDARHARGSQDAEDSGCSAAVNGALDGGGDVSSRDSGGCETQSWENDWSSHGGDDATHRCSYGSADAGS